MKKVVAFVGSPRKNGNVSTIVNEILRGAVDNGAEAKVYYLDDLNIKGCKSCLYCREHPSCCIKDDMQQIYEDVKAADSLVIGSPIFICQVSAQIKLLLDRFYPLTDKEHKPRFGTKRTVMVYTQAAPLQIFFRKYIKYNNKALKPMGIDIKNTIIATKSFTPDAASKNSRILEKAYKAGVSLA